jgi:hypothetical protein
MFTDAVYPYPGADATILLVPPAAVRKARVAERDARWGSRVLDRWEHLEVSRVALEAMAIDADLELSGALEIEVAAEVVVRWLRSRYPALVPASCAEPG